MRFRGKNFGSQVPMNLFHFFFFSARCQKNWNFRGKMLNPKYPWILKVTNLCCCLEIWINVWERRIEQKKKSPVKCEEAKVKTKLTFVGIFYPPKKTQTTMFQGQKLFSEADIIIAPLQHVKSHYYRYNGCYWKMLNHSNLIAVQGSST